MSTDGADLAATDARVATTRASVMPSAADVVSTGVIVASPDVIGRDSGDISPTGGTDICARGTNFSDDSAI
jgi:hypothetical protein